MASVDIRFPGNIAQVTNVADLRNIPSYMVEAASLYVVTDLGRAYTFDYSSLLTDDGANVIRPTDRTPLQAGRWIFEVDGFAPGATGPANSTYQTLAAMKAAPSTNASYILAAPNQRDIFTFISGDFSGKANDKTIVKLDSVSLATGALVSVDADLQAGNFGVMGDGVTDDTAAAQAFITWCESLGGRVAYFGSKRVRISGPLVSRGVAIVFDAACFGATGPGFYVTGSGYTAVTLSDPVPGSNFGVFGDPDGVATVVAGVLTSDTRTAVNGVQLGRPSDNIPLAGSNLGSIIVRKLAGFGTKFDMAWDGTYNSISIEECGTAVLPAFWLESTSPQTVNESVFTRVQVEQAVGRAILINPNTLNCNFPLIHSERTQALSGADTWSFGGSVSHSELRLQANNPEYASASFTSQNMVVQKLRAEGEFPIYVNSSGGTITFIEPTANAQFQPSPASSGTVNIIGGMYAVKEVAANWKLWGGAVSLLRVAGMGGGLFAEAHGCQIAKIEGSVSSTNGSLVLDNCTCPDTTIVGMANLYLLGHTSITIPANTTWLQQHIEIGRNAVVTVGNGAEILYLNNAGVLLDGTVQGDYRYTASLQTLIGPTGVITGPYPINAAPESGVYLGGLFEGMYMKNPKPAPTGSPGSQTIQVAWVRAGGVWVPTICTTGS